MSICPTPSLERHVLLQRSGHVLEALRGDGVAVPVDAAQPRVDHERLGEHARPDVAHQIPAAKECVC